MNFYSVRDLRTQPRQIWDKLAEVHELIITNNGKPSALMIEIDDENLEDVLLSVRHSMAMRATNRMRIQSGKNANQNLSMDEIESEIQAYRKKGTND